MNIISKIGTSPVSLVPQKSNDPTSPALQPQTKQQQGGTQVPPSFSTAALSVPGNVDTSTGHTVSTGGRVPFAKNARTCCVVHDDGSASEECYAPHLRKHRHEREKRRG